MGFGLLLSILVMGGIYARIFTSPEAAVFGAFFTLALALIRRSLTWKGFIDSPADTIRISCMIMVIVAGATIFGHLMAVTRLPFEISAWVGGLPLPHWAIMILIILIFLLGGCFMDAFVMVMLTIPIFPPVSQTLGFDPIRMKAFSLSRILLDRLINFRISIMHVHLYVALDYYRLLDVAELEGDLLKAVARGQSKKIKDYYKRLAKARIALRQAELARLD